MYISIILSCIYPVYPHIFSSLFISLPISLHRSSVLFIYLFKSPHHISSYLSLHWSLQFSAYLFKFSHIISSFLLISRHNKNIQKLFISHSIPSYLSTSFHHNFALGPWILLRCGKKTVFAACSHHSELCRPCCLCKPQQRQSGCYTCLLVWSVWFTTGHSFYVIPVRV